MPQGILVLGGKGYMGQRLLAAYPGAAVSDVDIADAPALAAELDRDRPAVVINCAGKTGRPNIDWCEDHKLETLPLQRHRSPGRPGDVPGAGYVSRPSQLGLHLRGR